MNKFEDRLEVVGKEELYQEANNGYFPFNFMEVKQATRRQVSVWGAKSASE